MLLRNYIPCTVDFKNLSSSIDPVGVHKQGYFVPLNFHGFFLPTRELNLSHGNSWIYHLMSAMKLFLSDVDYNIQHPCCRAKKGISTELEHTPRNKIYTDLMCTLKTLTSCY